LTFDERLLDVEDEDEEEDFVVVIVCFTTLVVDDDELVAEKLELELLVDENVELLVPVVITAVPPV